MRFLFILIICGQVWAGETINKEVFLPMHSKDAKLLINFADQVENRNNRLVVIAPGLADGKSAPLFEKIALRLSKQNNTVIRFSWQDELEEVDPRVDDDVYQHLLLAGLSFATPYIGDEPWPKEIIFIGKSYGSRVLANWIKHGLPHSAQGIREKIQLRGVLLTPNCSDQKPFDQQYGSYLKSIKKSLIIISKEDQYCDFSQIENSFWLNTHTASDIDLYTPNGVITFSTNENSDYLNISLLGKEFDNLKEK